MGKGTNPVASVRTLLSNEWCARDSYCMLFTGVIHDIIQSRDQQLPSNVLTLALAKRLSFHTVVKVRGG